MNSSVFKKMNLKDQGNLLILNAPTSFESEITLLKKANIFCDIEDIEKAEFVLAFVEQQDALDAIADKLLPRISSDLLLWFAYPKKSSKRYKSDITRDSGWAKMGEYHYEGVRQVAIDEDWSALRFRHVKYIPKLTRSKKMRLA